MRNIYSLFPACLNSAVTHLIQNTSSLFGLSLRIAEDKTSFLNERNGGVPFSFVLSWLCRIQNNFGMAACIALLLLGDLERAQEVCRLANSLIEPPISLHSHILDGIQPLSWCDSNAVSTDDNDDEVFRMKVASQNILLLADLALICLVKGEAKTLPVLVSFLKTNKYYDPSKGCAVLLGIFVNELRRLGGTPDNLWPVEALLAIATARDFLGEVMQLLNAAVPRELRGETVQRGDIRTDETLCAPLVGLILACTPAAPRALLDLTTQGPDRTSVRFWDSLSHQTKLKLSVVKSAQAHRLICELEIRTWALEMMQNFIASSTSLASADIEDDSTFVSWLQALCVACHTNRKIKWEKLARTNSSPFDDSDESEIPPNLSDVENYFNVVGKERNLVKEAITRAGTSDSAVFDFDLCIPCLLILEWKKEKWHKGATVSTQTLLNEVCHLAGRRRFGGSTLFDRATLLKQCGQMANADAAAHIIGGRIGFILKCSAILCSELSLNTSSAERVLLQKNAEKYVNGQSAREQEHFEPSLGQKRALILLSDHVLSVSKFSDFDASSPARGGVDPVFACRLCLRLWLLLNPNGAVFSAWLTKWLRTRLGISDGGTDSDRNSLACAAICRAILWPAEADDNCPAFSKGVQKEVIAKMLRFEASFLLDLTESCLGLVESIPSTTVAEALGEDFDSDPVTVVAQALHEDSDDNG
jgi:hypothetical protein